MANLTAMISIPPAGHSTADFKCTVQNDFHVLMYANHMHDYGTSASTELIAADGTVAPLQVDAVWDPSWAFHPNYTKFSMQAPKVIPAGSTLHTTCTWSNRSSATVAFPDEMCVFGAIFLGNKDVACAEGAWH